MWALRAAPAPRHPTFQFSIALPAALRLGGLEFPAVAIAPEDTHVAFVATLGGRQQLFIHSLSSGESVPLAGTEGALSPFFSPDGAWVGFFADEKLKVVAIGGGPVRTIADAPIGFGASWGPDDTIVFAPNNASALWRVPAGGGTPSPVTELKSEGEFSHRWPEVLPDGEAVIFTAGGEGSWDDAEIAWQPLGGGARRTVVRGGTGARYLAGGHLLYARGGSLHLAPFDAASGQLTGKPAVALEGVAQSIDGAVQASASRLGSLLYLPGGPQAGETALVWVDRRGDAQPLAAPPLAYAAPRLSPDGRTLAVTIGADRDDVWTYDLGAARLTRFTYEGGSSPVWSSDGSRIYFSAARDGPPNLFERAADGSGVDVRLTHATRVQSPHSTWDGRLAFVESDPQAGREIRLLSTNDGSVRPFAATPADETAPAFSPDGRLLAFASDELGTSQVFVALVANPARRARVSSDGGTEPLWRRDGAELFFRSGDHLLAAVVRPTLTVETPRVLFSGRYQAGAGGRAAYDVSPDGARFLMVRAADEEQASRELRMIVNWRR